MQLAVSCSAAAKTYLCFQTQALNILPVLHQRLLSLDSLVSSRRLQQQFLAASLGVLCPEAPPPPAGHSRPKVGIHADSFYLHLWLETLNF